MSNAATQLNVARYLVAAFAVPQGQAMDMADDLIALVKAGEQGKEVAIPARQARGEGKVGKSGRWTSGQ